MSEPDAPELDLDLLRLELEACRAEIGRLRGALRRIVEIDYRGNRHPSAWIAEQALDGN